MNVYWIPCGIEHEWNNSKLRRDCKTIDRSELNIFGSIELILNTYKRKSIIFVKFATEYMKYVSWGIILDVYIFIGSDILNTC